MFHKLLVPLDGSDSAERAVPYAVRLARAGRGGIALVQVAVAQPPMLVDGVDWGQYQTQAVDDAERYLSAMARKLADQVPVETVVVPIGSAAFQILAQVRHLKTDGIVMATHGRTGLAHLLFGSVAEAVLAQSEVPVFLVHSSPHMAVEPRFDPLAARLMVPLDGSRFAEAALAPALDFLGSAGELVLVTVVEPPDHILRNDSGRVVAYLDQQAEAHMREGRCYLETVARRVRQANPQIHVSVDVRMEEPSTGIPAAAAERAVDLVVMATHGRTGLRRDAVGSVAGDVLRIGTAPLLLVHPVMAPQQAEQPEVYARQPLAS
jgi:nucleotide-binding universal stress UspA family protein